MRTWEERVKFRYGVTRHGGGNFRITVAGVPDNEAAGVDCGFHTISSFVPSYRPGPQSPIPSPIFSLSW